jgi:hypothetical membrane protein
MRPRARRWAGLLLFAGAIAFAIGMTVAQAAFVGYNTSHEFLGDLGVGPTAVLFNGSIMFLGAAFVAAAALLARAFRNRSLAIALALAGIGMFGFGAVPATEDFMLIHTGFAFLAYVCGVLAPILAARLMRPPLRYVSAALGVVSFAALGLLAAKVYLIFDRGGMERLIVWPFLVWAMIAGGSLLKLPSRSSDRRTSARSGSA